MLLETERLCLRPWQDRDRVPLAFRIARLFESPIESIFTDDAE